MEVDSDEYIESGWETDLGGEAKPHNRNDSLKPCDQRRLNDMVRDLGIPKDATELLASNKSRFAENASGTFCRHRNSESLSIFTTEESLVHCKNVRRLFDCLEAGIFRCED